jgi:hypothetical protein
MKNSGCSGTIAPMPAEPTVFDPTLSSGNSAEHTDSVTHPDVKVYETRGSEGANPSPGAAENNGLVIKDDAVPKEVGGRDGPEPTRFGDWEKNGRCIDF